MPVTIPKKSAPAPAPAPTPAKKPVATPAAPPPISHEQVRAMLDKQAAEFSRQIETMTKAFTGALTAAMSQPRDKPSAGWDFKVEYHSNGDIDTIQATPRTPTRDKKA